MAENLQAPKADPNAPAKPAPNKASNAAANGSPPSTITAGVLASAVVILLVHLARYFLPKLFTGQHDWTIPADITAALTSLVTFIISYKEPNA